jgi:hypothetical protein
MRPDTTVPTFTPIELCKRAPAHVFVVDEVKGMQGFVDAPEFGDALRQSSRVLTDLQGAHDAGGRHPALQERPAKSEHIIPVWRNSL